MNVHDWLEANERRKLEYAGTLRIGG